MKKDTNKLSILYAVLAIATLLTLLFLFLPIYTNGTIGIESPFIWVFAICNIISMLSAYGKLGDTISTTSLQIGGASLMLQCILHAVFSFEVGIEWSVYLCLVFIYIVYFIIFFYNKIKFPYITEPSKIQHKGYEYKRNKKNLRKYL